MTDTHNRDKSQRYAVQNELDTKEYIHILLIPNSRIKDNLIYSDRKQIGFYLAQRVDG